MALVRGKKESLTSLRLSNFFLLLLDVECVVRSSPALNMARGEALSHFPFTWMSLVSDQSGSCLIIRE